MPFSEMIFCNRSRPSVEKVPEWKAAGGRLVALGSGGPDRERLVDPATIKMLARIAFHSAGCDLST